MFVLKVKMLSTILVSLSKVFQIDDALYTIDFFKKFVLGAGNLKV